MCFCFKMLQNECTYLDVCICQSGLRVSPACLADLSIDDYLTMPKTQITTCHSGSCVLHEPVPWPWKQASFQIQVFKLLWSRFAALRRMQLSSVRPTINPFERPSDRLSVQSYSDARQLLSWELRHVLYWELKQPHPVLWLWNEVGILALNTIRILRVCTPTLEGMKIE